MSVVFRSCNNTIYTYIKWYLIVYWRAAFSLFVALCVRRFMIGSSVNVASSAMMVLDGFVSCLLVVCGSLKKFGAYWFIKVKKMTTFCLLLCQLACYFVNKRICCCFVLVLFCGALGFRGARKTFMEDVTRKKNRNQASDGIKWAKKARFHLPKPPANHSRQNTFEDTTKKKNINLLETAK